MNASGWRSLRRKWDIMYKYRYCIGFILCGLFFVACAVESDDKSIPDGLSDILSIHEAYDSNFRNSFFVSYTLEYTVVDRENSLHQFEMENPEKKGKVVIPNDERHHISFSAKDMLYRSEKTDVNKRSYSEILAYNGDKLDIYREFYGSDQSVRRVGIIKGTDQKQEIEFCRSLYKPPVFTISSFLYKSSEYKVIGSISEELIDDKVCKIVVLNKNNEDQVKFWFSTTDEYLPIKVEIMANNKYKSIYKYNYKRYNKLLYPKEILRNNYNYDKSTDSYLIHSIKKYVIDELSTNDIPMNIFEIDFHESIEVVDERL